MEKQFIEKMITEVIKDINKTSDERALNNDDLSTTLLRGATLSHIDVATRYDKCEAIEEYKRVCKSFYPEWAPFPALNLIGIWGTVLETKHGVDRDELLKIFTKETGLKLIGDKK